MEKKVCILTSVHPVTDTRIFVKEAQSLKRDGYNLTLIGQNDKKEIINGIKIIPIEKPSNRFERIFKISFQLFRKALKADAEIYHFHDPELITIGFLLKLKGKKVIYDVHEDVPKQILSKEWMWGPFKKIISKVTEYVEKLADRYLDAIISATPVINKKFNNKNSITVQNFPLLSELTGTINNKGKYNKNYIVYVGGITSERGIKEMVKAVELVPDNYNIELLLAGKFSSKELKKDVKQLKGWKKVKFMGWVNREKISNILSKSKVGLVVLQPSDRYKVSYPVKMFEYMSASLPVLASNFPLWEEIIEGNNCGINVNPTEANEIANGIKYILDNPQKAKKMGKNGRRAIEEKYNWSIEKEKLLNIYKKLSKNDKNIK